MLTARSVARGFTLIELMIGLALLAFILMLGVPAFSTFIQNQKLRDNATLALAQIQFARAEALRLNANVDFLMSDTEPDIGNFTTLAVSTAGRNFLVRGNVYNPANGQMETKMLTTRSADEGSGAAPGSTAGVQIAASTGTVTFTPLGGTTLAADEVIQFTNPAGGNCTAAGGPMRCLNVVITRGGQVRLCDPSVTAAADTRRC
jgi:type IV fimbrial biogenesis protein FimT